MITNSSDEPQVRTTARQLAIGVAANPAGWITGASLRFGVVVTAALLLFWAFDALPFMDLPAHAGLIALRHRITESPFDRQFYLVAPHLGPYSLFRGLAEVLLRLTTPIGAVRVLAALPVVATPAAILFARYRLHGDRSLAPGYLAVVLSFGLMTMFGFASYLLGIAIALVAVTLWLELMLGADQGAPLARRQTLASAALAPLVFLAHGHAFLIFGGTAVVTCLATGRRWRRLLHLVALLPAAAIAGYSVYLNRTLPADAVLPSAFMTPLFQGPLDKLSLLLTPTLTTRVGVDVGVGVILWVLLGLGTVATVRALPRATRALVPTYGAIAASEAHTRALLVGAAAVAVAFLGLPHEIGWFGFVDGRLVPIVLLMGLLALRRTAFGPRLARAFDRLPPALAIVAVGWMWFASAKFQPEAYGYREVFAAVPANVRLLNLPLDPDSAIFTGHPFVHYDKLIMVARPLVLSDVWFHQGTGVYPRATNPELRLPTNYNSSTIRTVDWKRYQLDEWDYALIRTRPESPPPNTPPALLLVSHQGGWWLYRNTDATPAVF